MVDATSAAGNSAAANTSTKTSTGTSTGTGTASLASIDSNYQDFLKLLTTQLQNQDPTAPADTNQLTQQIATLSSVEQQIDMNKNLQQLISLYSGSQTQNAVSYIGKQIETDGNQSALQGGQAALVYELPAGVTTATLTIKDSTGATVYSGNGTTIAGRNQVIWNGTNTAGKQLDDGTYTFSVAATDSSKKAVTDGVTTHTSGIVKSVDTDSTGTSTLSLGDLSVAIDKVLSIRTPTA